MRASAARHHGQARSAPVGAPQPPGEGGSRMHVHLGGSGAHRTAAAASSTRPQHGRTAEAAASPAAAARCSRGRRSAVGGGCCGGAASCGGGLAAQPMNDTRHQHMSPGAAPTSKHLHCIVKDLLRSRRTERAEWRLCAALFKYSLLLRSISLFSIKKSHSKIRPRLRWH